MWDITVAEQFEAWYATPRGSFALAREQRLIADMISPWQRRNHTLLEIGCGVGHFLEMFHDGGFDVTGIDKNEIMLKKARARMGYRATLQIADATHLPFDDGEFDYVALVTALKCMDDPKAVLEEAFRVATRGVVIAYLNAWSFYHMEQSAGSLWRKYKQTRGNNRAVPAGVSALIPDRRPGLLKVKWFNLYSLCRLIREVSGKRPSAFRSTLFSPSFWWRGQKPFSLSTVQLAPFGAVSVVRVDMMPVAATTTLIRPPKIPQAARASAGAMTMDRYNDKSV